MLFYNIHIRNNLLMGVIILVLLIFSSITASSVDSCLGYDNSTAYIAAQFGTCASVTTDYLPQIYSWNYTYCLTAQKQKKFIEDISLIERRSHNLLALSLYDREKDLIVLSFRATVCGEKNANGKTDLNLALKEYRQWGCKYGICQVHSGFLNSYNLMKEQIREKAISLMNKHKTAKFLVTGVSLGASLATIASYDLKMFTQSKEISTKFLFYTFGQPRVGNYYFVRQINRKITLYRVVDASDPVPHLPPRQLPGTALTYFNAGIQIYYQKSNQSSIGICQGDNSKCSLKRRDLFYVCDHLYYPLMNFQKPKCDIKTNKFNFQINELQIYKQNERIIGFFMHQCKVVCMNMDSMLCPQYRIPELHCSPIEMRKLMLQNFQQLWIRPIQEQQGKSRRLTICDFCNSLFK